ncbi:MAG: tol-pal system protein YbgF [Acetobacter sp.]|nr:tol-pal system protein YbgF [Acetobacter sp.]
MKRINLFSDALLLASVFTFTALADDTYLRDELDQIKDDIVVLQRQMYREKAELDAPKEEVSDFHVRFGEYDQMIRDMNGKVENIEFRLNNLEKKMEMIDKDIDLRFSQLKKQTPPIASDSTTQTGNKKNTNTAKAPAGVKPKELYEKALNDLKANKLSDAETKFSQFLTSYPKDTLAGNAQYWLGEVYYKQQNFAKAAVAFKEGYSKYPEGSKGPDCLLKLGLSMKALNKKSEACTAFVNLPTIFGKVNPDISARAKKEAEALACK